MGLWLTAVNMLYNSLPILQEELDQVLQLQSMDQPVKYPQVLLASSLLVLGFSL